MIKYDISSLLEDHSDSQGDVLTFFGATINLDPHADVR